MGQCRVVSGNLLLAVIEGWNRPIPGVLYRGYNGFTVFEPSNGYHYSSRSCCLLLLMLKALEFSPLWITCN